jgi:pyruvate/2-oxoglutarate/acetoin dehydrogenase E1 component
VGGMSKYFENLCVAMEMLAQHERALFMGQAVAFKGTAMTETFRNIAPDKLLELPVAEDMQMGLCIGYSLDGGLPISVYPRFNFLLLAVNQLVLHLDKMPIYSVRRYQPKVIIRTAVASSKLLDPGAQHVGDFTDMFQRLLYTVHVVDLWNEEDIVPAYLRAMKSDRSTLLVEHAARY